MDNKQTIVLFLFFAFALNITLCQDQVPAPYNFAVASVAATSVTLEWVRPDSGKGYEITTTERYITTVSKTDTIYELDIESFVITDLKVLSAYTFSMKTVSDNSFSREISLEAVTLPQPTDIAVQIGENGKVTFTITSDEKDFKHYNFLLELSQDDKLVLQVIAYKTEIIVCGLSNGKYTPSVTATWDNYKGQTFKGKDFTLDGVTEGADVDAPSGLKAYTYTSAIVIEWNQAASGTGYQMTVGLNSVPYYLHGLENTELFAYNLSPCTEYLVTVRTTSEGSKLSNEKIEISIKTDGPLVLGTRVEETVPPSGKLTVYWNPIKPIGICNWLYVIIIHNLKGSEYKAYASSNASFVELYNVAAQWYELMVPTSINGALGPMSCPWFRKKVFKAGKAPSDPTDLKVTDQSATTISLSWTPAIDAVGYQYTLNHNDSKFIINGGLTSGVMIPELTPSTKYTITVSSLTESSVSSGKSIIANTN